MTRIAITPLAIALVVLVPAAAHALPHPPPLGVRDGCERWIGRASGNDPDVRVNLRICPGADGALTGEVQWSSTTSGWNVRAVEGRRDGDQLTLRDTRIVEERPAPGWRFCTIDRYALAPESPDVLVGRYDSTACNDHATLRLERMPDEPPPAQPPAPTKTAAEDPTYREPIPDAPPPAAREEAGCGCRIAPAPAAPRGARFVGLTAVVVVAVARRRLRPLTAAPCTSRPGRPRRPRNR